MSRELDVLIELVRVGRQAAASFHPNEDDKILEGMIDQMNKTTARANAAIDEALAYVDASNKRIERKG